MGSIAIRHLARTREGFNHFPAHEYRDKGRSFYDTGHIVPYPRLSDPFCESPYNSGRYIVHVEHESLLLDFDTMTREEQE
ncbi:MAG TPA: hypothetical protein VKM55_10700 [Candidatus Lokiarchaeia archaeon]|nr:hypothetical protein [Candidatus Lokiarchaeia archaeon]